MTRAVLLLVAGVVLLAGVAIARDPAPSPTPTPAVQDEPILRGRVLEFGVALGNEGFKVRDGIWPGRVEPRRPQRLAVNLFEGNQYWFCAAVGDHVARPKMALYDPSGEKVSALDFTEPGLVAAGVTAGETGRYVVELRASEGQAADFVLLYLFK